MKRTMTGRPSGRTMTLGELREFVATLEALPDEATVRARLTLRKQVRSVTVEEDDTRFRDYTSALSEPDTPDVATKLGGRKERRTAEA